MIRTFYFASGSQVAAASGWQALPRVTSGADWGSSRSKDVMLHFQISHAS
jgi:hypothetical protein